MSYHILRAMVEARNAVKQMFPQSYDDLIAAYRNVIEAKMAKRDPPLTVLEATADAVAEADMAGAGRSVINILAATFVEMITERNQHG